MGLITIDSITARKLINIYTMVGIFGKPGSGKSIYLTKLQYQHSKRGWTVYTDDATSKVPGVKYFDSEKHKKGLWLPCGKKGYPAWHDGTKTTYEEIDALIKAKDAEGLQKLQEKGACGPINKEQQNIVMFWDEIGSTYFSRNFKEAFTPETLRWWKEHRHRKVKVYYASQSYKDMDLVLRKITDKLYIIKRALLKNFAIAKPIFITLEIQNSEMGDSQGGQIVEQYKYDMFLFWKPILLRRWINKFDSYR